MPKLEVTARQFELLYEALDMMLDAYNQRDAEDYDMTTEEWNDRLDFMSGTLDLLERREA